MTDTRLGELRRAWEASADPAAEAAYLVERLRVGELSREQVRLAAYFGSPAAAQAVDEGGPPPPAGLDDWIDWLSPDPQLEVFLRLLLEHGPLSADEVVVRSGGLIERSQGCLVERHHFMSVAVRCRDDGVVAYDRDTELYALSDAPRARRWLEIRAWLGDTPDATLRVRAALYRIGLPLLVETELEETVCDLLARYEAWVLCPNELNERLWWRARKRSTCLSTVSARVRAGEVVAPEVVRATVRDELVPWVLGYADPLLLRAEPAQD